MIQILYNIQIYLMIHILYHIQFYSMIQISYHIQIYSMIPITIIIPILNTIIPIKCTISSIHSWFICNSLFDELVMPIQIVIQYTVSKLINSEWWWLKTERKLRVECKKSVMRYIEIYLIQSEIYVRYIWVKLFPHCCSNGKESEKRITCQQLLQHLTD